MWDPYAEFKTATLPNGLTVHAAHWPGRPWEAMGFIVHSGAEQDPVGLEGLAHFVEHLVSENAGVAKKVIEAFFEDCGGAVNLGGTSYSDTLYQFFVPIVNGVVKTAFDYFGQMLFLEKIERLIERERQVIVGEFHRSYPARHRYELIMRTRRALYSDCWLGRSARPFGTLDAISQITQRDLQSYYDKHYVPANISVVGVGGMTVSEITDILAKSPFAQAKAGGRNPLPAVDTVAPHPLETRCVYVESDHVKMTVPLESGWYQSIVRIPAIPGANSSRVLKILKEMLNEALDDEVRQRRAWAYSISCGFDNWRRFHEFHINCNALALKALDEIEEVVEVCIASMQDGEDLFKQAKRRVLASNFMVDETGKDICRSAIFDLAKYQRIISLTEYGAEIERVTMDDIKNLLIWLRPEHRFTVVGRP